MTDLVLYLNRHKVDFDYLTYDNTNHEYANEIVCSLLDYLEFERVRNVGFSWAFKNLTDDEIILLKLTCTVKLIIKKIEIYDE